MLPLKCLRKSSLKCLTNQTLLFSTSPSPPPFYPPTFNNTHNLQPKDVVLSFKQWFKRRNNNPLFDQIYHILTSQNDLYYVHNSLDSPFPHSTDLALSQLGLRLSESFVLQVLNYGQDVLSCLKFFDWAGRQPGFHHTRATFTAIFKILSRAKLMSLMLDFLNSYARERHVYKRVRFYDTLVMGYAVAGRPEIALSLFGKMRFQGLDLDGFGYHVLLNALVEESCFDVVDVIVKQIRMRGFESEVTRSIVVKSLCKQRQLDEAEEFLREGEAVSEYVVGTIVDALCKESEFERAGKLIEEFGVESAYGMWIRGLVLAGKLDAALEFFKRKKDLEGYVPDAFRYNTLIYRLLRENRLEEVFDLLMEMKEGQMSPDRVTMNAVLCFFCKAGMVDVALELYKSRAEIGLTPNSMAYNYLINTLCGDGSVDEAYRVLKNSMDQGFFPGRKTFSILADALCREGKIDKMKELLVFALERNFTPTDSTYEKFISALCKARRVEDGYLIHGALNRIDKVVGEYTYYNLIHGFNKTKRGDIAARLLIDMQEKGHTPDKKMFGAVIRCLCDMDNPEEQFLKLLEMQLSRQESNCQIYNFFIDGAGRAKKPELARGVYEMMGRSGIEPNKSSKILMLKSYLKSERVSDALNFFNELRERGKIGRRYWNTMVVGLCKANKLDIALELLGEMREIGMFPSLECYEELVKLLCSNRKYDTVVNIIDDLEKVGRGISSFIGNVLLLHSLNTQELYDAWVRSRDVHEGASSSKKVGQLIGAFCGRVRLSQRFEDLEVVIEQCFRPGIYTYNMLLRRVCMSEMDLACEFFNRICQKGYEPNQWTYDILVHGFFKHGRTAEAKLWMEEMFRKGFEPTERTKLLI